MPKQQKTGLIWFTKNLRVLDNYTLQMAVADNHKVLGIFFFDPREFEPTPHGFKKTERYRAKFLLESLAQLRDSLKVLQIDWRLGAAYFEAMLLDYDVHSNYGNWMYVAGVGNDPRDRKFNVRLQSERYDPSGKYQNIWLRKTLFE